jgi:hypothetical protein
LAQRIRLYIYEDSGGYKGGFSQGRSTVDHIFTIGQILEKSYEYNISLRRLYGHFRQAFDNIGRFQIVKAMKEFGMPATLSKI